jgi:hypothetical protein
MVQRESRVFAGIERPGPIPFGKGAALTLAQMGDSRATTDVLRNTHGFCLSSSVDGKKALG